MKNVMKKVIAAVLAASMCLSLAGCYSEAKTIAATKGDDTMPIGGYIYYLSSAYSEAMSKVSTEEQVLKSTIDGENAETWIENRALNYLNAYYYINDKFDELGLELTDEDNESITSTTESFWTYYKSGMEEMGISKDSFNKAYTVYNTKYKKVVDTMLSEGGELAVSDDELKSYFTENYYSYEYFTVSLTTTDSEGNSTDMSDEEKTATKEKLENHVAKINNGDMTVSEAASEYAEEALGSADSSTYYAPDPVLADNMAESMKSAIEGAKDNEAVLVENTNGYYVVRRLSISDKFADQNADSTKRLNIIYNMKGDEISDYIMEQAKEYTGIEYNMTAINSVKISAVVSDSNKNGTSSAAAEDDTSSEVSSAAESETETESTEE